MIIYGSKNKQLAKETLMDKCPHCGNQHCIDMHVFQKYVHLFWLPLFPIGKTGVSQCDHCKQVLKLNQMPGSLKTSYDNIKSGTKTPLWMFTGLAVIAIIITMGILSERKKDERNATLILTPFKGDIYEIKTNEGQYTLYKVDQTIGDTVFVRFNQFESNKISGLTDLKQKGDTAFIDDLVPILKPKLREMLKNGEIIDIKRN
jgi:hypothetical protein